MGFLERFLYISGFAVSAVCQIGSSIESVVRALQGSVQVLRLVSMFICLQAGWGAVVLQVQPMLGDEGELAPQFKPLDSGDLGIIELRLCK